MLAVSLPWGCTRWCIGWVWEDYILPDLDSLGAASGTNIGHHFTNAGRLSCNGAMLVDGEGSPSEARAVTGPCSSSTQGVQRVVPLFIDIVLCTLFYSGMGMKTASHAPSTHPLSVSFIFIVLAIHFISFSPVLIIWIPNKSLFLPMNTSSFPLRKYSNNVFFCGRANRYWRLSHYEKKQLIPRPRPGVIDWTRPGSAAVRFESMLFLCLTYLKYCKLGWFYIPLIKTSKSLHVAFQHD